MGNIRISIEFDHNRNAKLFQRRIWCERDRETEFSHWKIHLWFLAYSNYLWINSNLCLHFFSFCLFFLFWFKNFFFRIVFSFSKAEFHHHSIYHPSMRFLSFFFPHNLHFYLFTFSFPIINSFICFAIHKAIQHLFNCISWITWF